MGYSIYWTPKKLTEEQVPDQFWKDCEKVLDKIISKGIILATPDGTEVLDSGHKIINYWEPEENKAPGLGFNGFVERGCESFCLVFDGEWNFCKTRREPYDLAVKCILMLADKYDLLENSDVDNRTWSFDGNEKDPEYIEANNLMIEMELI
jgi:hypothetical protein